MFGTFCLVTLTGQRCQFWASLVNNSRQLVCSTAGEKCVFEMENNVLLSKNSSPALAKFS
jgi:hypothetical protein